MSLTQTELPLHALLRRVGLLLRDSEVPESKLTLEGQLLVALLQTTKAKLLIQAEVRRRHLVAKAAILTRDLKVA